MVDPIPLGNTGDNRKEREDNRKERERVSILSVASVLGLCAFDRRVRRPAAPMVRPTARQRRAARV